MDQHIADLLGLDLTDPEVIAAIAEADAEHEAAVVEAASDAIDRACAEQQERDPEMVARFDAQRERTEQTLGCGLFERAHESVQLTYVRAQATEA